MKVCTFIFNRHLPDHTGPKGAVIYGINFVRIFRITVVFANIDQLMEFNYRLARKKILN